MGCAGFSNTIIINTEQTVSNKPPTYEEILNQDKKTLPTYQEAMKFEKGTDAFAYFKGEINSSEPYIQPSTSLNQPRGLPM